jgi:hypothetical protein
MDEGEDNPSLHKINEYNPSFQKINKIDSLAAYMDSAIFQSVDTIREKGIVEYFESKGDVFDEQFPDFGKVTVHHHSNFIDSCFYYYKGEIIKLQVTRSNEYKPIDSSNFYFENDLLANLNKMLDSNSIKLLQGIAKNHLERLKKIVLDTTW